MASACCRLVQITRCGCGIWNSGAQLMHFYGHAGAPTAIALRWMANSCSTRPPITRCRSTISARGAAASAAWTQRGDYRLRPCIPTAKRVLTAARDHKLAVEPADRRRAADAVRAHRRDHRLPDHQDGRRAVSAGWDHSVRIWDLATGRLLHALHGHQGSGQRAVPSARRAARGLGVLGSLAHHLAPGQWARRCQLSGHSAPINAVLATADGRF